MSALENVAQRPVEWLEYTSKKTTQAETTRARMRYPRYRELVEMPEAQAIRLLEEGQQGGPLDLGALTDEVVSALCLRLALFAAMAGPSGPADWPRFSEWRDAVERARAERGLRQVAPESEAEHIEKLSALFEAAHALNFAGPDRGPAERLQRIGESEEALRAFPADLSLARRQDIAHLEVEFAELRAAALVELGLVDDAEVAFRAAIERAAAADALVPDKSYRRRTWLRYCEWLGRQDADATLSQFLPVIHEALAAEPDADSLALQVFLVNFFYRFGDWAFTRSAYEVRHRPLAGGEPVYDRARSLTIWQRQPDGSWLASRHMNNRPRPGP